MKSLVTGGAGFIGSWIVDSLIDKGHEVIVIDNLSTGKEENLNKKAVFYKKDILDKEIIQIFLKEKPDYVFHLAAQINVRRSIENPSEDAQTNILGTLNLLDACTKSKVKKFIFSSTGGAIYGEDVKIPTLETEKTDPISPYGIAKFTIEKYLEFYKKVYGLDYTILRYSNVYGPRQNAKGEAGVIAIFVTDIIKNKSFTIFGDGEQTRDYVYVKDVADANILALNLSGIFNIGTEKETSVNDLIKTLESIEKSKFSVKNINAIKGELKRSCLSSEKIKKAGWKQQYNLEKGLKETLDYFKNQES